MSLCNKEQTKPALAARKILLSGQVQGVGFRPFIYRLAQEHNLNGWVRNCVGVVEVQVQGEFKNIENFLIEIFTKKPVLADPKLASKTSVEFSEINNFSILKSEYQGESNISVPNDLFLCDDCLTELNDPSDRRYRYPFINCTQCGPRYTLIKALPYDRPNTTMTEFELCPPCLAEYEDPNNRRFHAEPVACADCGPTLSFQQDQTIIEDNEASIKNTIEVLRQGQVVAVKGIGGYHLMCDASNTDAVSRLRKKKSRPDKPLAIMFPAPVDEPFKYAEHSVNLSEDDKAFLLKPSRPILLVAESETSELSELVAPGLNEIGIMLPYSPLHHLLLNDFVGPLVVTSANISGEPVLIDNHEVNKRLAHIADAFLHHNRPIERPADDPVYRTIAGKVRPIRTGRGLAPLELTLPFKLEKPVLAVGAQMKNTITLAWENRAVISPHIGEMDTARGLKVFESTINDLQKLYGIKVAQIICDAHPSYTTTRWAKKQNLAVHQIYHHHAHASAAYYECETDEDIIAFTWDGVGYGEDGTLWGGETFLGRPGQWKRLASMRPFKLPGGDKAGREPWRSAAALCWETGQAYDAMPEKNPLLKQAWQEKINAPQSSSIGRIFDAAAALTATRISSSYEAQAAMEFEALYKNNSSDYIKLDLDKAGDLLITDWALLVAAMLNKDASLTERSSLFHHSLAEVMLQQAKAIRDKYAVNTICLSGGVFQNRAVTEYAMALLVNDGFKVNLPELIPVNDAGISFGQIMEYGFSQQE